MYNPKSRPLEILTGGETSAWLWTIDLLQAQERLDARTAIPHGRGCELMSNPFGLYLTLISWELSPMEGF